MSAEGRVRAKPASPPPSVTPVAKGLLQRKCACGGSPGPSGECEECGKKRLSMQRKAEPAGGVSSVPSIVHEVLRSPGSPLDGETRTFMESRFGHDFGQVRVHTDAKAARSAQSVNSLAYTVGQNVVFGEGQYFPHSGAGRRLLAHELTHVIQQGVSAAPIPQDLEIDPTASGEAEAAASERGVEAFAGAWETRTHQPPALQRREDRPPAGETPDTDTDTEPQPASWMEDLEALGRWLLQLLRESLRVLEQVGTMPEPLPREAPPANLSPNCRTFGSRADLDVRKAHWAGIIAGMAPADVISWLIGVSSPPRAVSVEARQQIDCMMEGIQASAAAPGSTITLPPSSQWIQSPHRGFSRQQDIWNRKFEFRGAAFDRISAHARTVCGSLLLSTETRWNPSEPRHRVCWGVAPLAGSTAPALPAGARALTADERQQEILQASSAPGISRHHSGTDFDLFDPDMNPEDWQAGRPFADEYSWLMRNAATYGFIQSFTATSTFMTTGYMEERWHWSYWPIAQALLEFARAHQTDINTELMRRWGSSPQFSYIRRHWREYMFNVSETPIF